MIKSSWFYVKFKHAEKVSALRCSPSLEVSPGIGFPVAPEIRLCPELEQRRARAADVAETSARCRWKGKAQI